MRSFIYASTNSVVTERLGRTGFVGMNLLRAEDPALPRFDGRPAALQPLPASSAEVELADHVFWRVKTPDAWACGAVRQRFRDRDRRVTGFRWPESWRAIQ